MTLAYSALDQVEALEWVSDLKPEKIVIVDFGGRGGALRKLLDLIKNDKELEGVKIVIIHIGDEPKVRPYHLFLNSSHKDVFYCMSGEKCRANQIRCG